LPGGQSAGTPGGNVVVVTVGGGGVVVVVGRAGGVTESEATGPGAAVGPRPVSPGWSPVTAAGGVGLVGATVAPLTS
jgi:hypothetical protein